MLRPRAVAPLLILALAGAHAAPAVAKTVTIGVDDDFFAPKTKTVKKGDKLKFVWRGSASHNVRTTGAAKKESEFMTSGTFAFKARKKGTINLICDIHEGMTGKVKVK